MEEEEENTVIVRFVLPKGRNETTCSEDLSYAFEQAQDVGLNPVWIDHDDVLKLNPSKMDVFVMDPFDGSAFDMVAQSKATLVGPRCILSCLQKKEPVPELPYPMFTAAMKGLIVTSTGFEKEAKMELQKLVERMAGIYSNAFHDGVTHLIAAVVRSSKYEVAVQKDIPIMTADWVHQVWNKSQNDNVDAVDRQFTRYACPSLMGLNICVSQMSSKDKELLKKSIESHGGIYSKTLDMNSTNVLIVPAPDGEKYNYARKWKIPTLNSNWVFDSIEKGYCLRTDSYRVEKTQCSTPTKDGDVSKLQEVSLCSTITGPPADDTLTNKVNETVEPANSTVLAKSSSISSIGDMIFKNLDLARVKKAGLFLDGCRIYLSGFDESQQDHLRRVLQSAGATRMTQLTPSVTHMVVKSFAKNRQLKELNLTPFQVSLQWVVESMRLGRIAPESDFPPKAVMAPPLAPPPLPTFTSEDEKQFETTQFDNDLMAQYSKKEDDDTEIIATQSKIFTNKKLFLLGLDNETEQDLTEWVTEEGGGTIVFSHEKVVDYLVVPVYGIAQHDFEAQYIVNHLWLADCLEKEELLPIEYFHRPILIDIDIKPVKDVVIGISGFCAKERQFICDIAEALGMTAQETFSKKDRADSKRSTHLVCLAPEGNKYEAALRWGLPVVNKDWILTCAKNMAWISERSFLIGDSKCFTEGKPEPSLDDTEIVFNNNNDNDTEHDTAVTPTVSMETLRKRARTFAFDTPGDKLDLEKLRPKKIEVSPSMDHWKNRPMLDSQPSPGIKRKTPDDERNDHDDKDIDDEEGSINALPFQLSAVNTPKTPYGAFLGNDDPPARTRKFWKFQYDMIVNHRPDEETITALKEKEEALEQLKRERDQERKRDEETRVKVMKDYFDPDRIRAEREAAWDKLEAKGIPILERAGRSFDDLMEEKFQKLGKSWKNPAKRIKLITTSSKKSDKSRGVMTGITVYVTKKLSSNREEIFQAVSQMNGKVSETYSSDDVTHVVFSSSRANDVTKEFRQARSDGKRIVSPEWIFMCKDENRLVDESLFPHTYNSKLSLMMSFNDNKKSDEIAREVAKMEEYILNDRESTKSNVKITLTSTESTPNRSKSIPDTQSSMDPQTIQWLDPKEDIEDQKLKVKLGSKPPMRFMISGISDDDSKFQFIKLIEDDDGDVTFANVNGCDETATHLIAGKLNRSEKMLGSIASGKMFLHPSYIQKCLEAESLLPVAEFEWGNPENLFLKELSDDNDNDDSCFERQLAKASYKWRRKREEQKPFEGIVAIIHTSAKRREAFQRLLELGGGVVITPFPPYDKSENATHCFAEPSKIPKVSIDYESLALSGVAVVNPLYINEYLIKDPAPPVDNHLIEEFKPFWKRGN